MFVGMAPGALLVPGGCLTDTCKKQAHLSIASRVPPASANHGRDADARTSDEPQPIQRSESDPDGMGTDATGAREGGVVLDLHRPDRRPAARDPGGCGVG